MIAGYVPPSDSAKSVGARVLGYHDGGTLTFVGRVGTGFTAETASSRSKEAGARCGLVLRSSSGACSEHKHRMWVEP